MKQTDYFLKTSKTKPADDVSVNARLLEQGGFVRKEMAGVYSFLPLGFRVLQKVEQIVREEMDGIGAGEVLLPALHPKESWDTTGRWQSLDVLFKLESQHGNRYALGPTHEEVVTPMAVPVISSYKDLPKAIYQIQTKFRDEPRAKSGLLRGREFRMKDLYSFHASPEDLESYYATVVTPTYRRVFERMGLKAILTEASGGTFSKFSHEYQVEIPSGEDVIYVCERCNTAKNREVFEPTARCTICGPTTWREAKASEVGNIFKLNDRFSGPFGLSYTDREGRRKPVLMGCYGIGTTRLVGVIVERFHDERGIIWPRAVAPFAVHLLALKGAEREADELYRGLREQGVEVLYDDRDLSPGVKFADSDLLGLPVRLVVSQKTVEQGSVELKRRAGAQGQLVPTRELFERLKDSDA